MINCVHVIVTGCGGFIGSSLVDRLLAQGHRVTGIDNFSTGQRRFLADALKNLAFKLVEGDLLDLPVLTKALAGGNTVFHFAANADVRFGTEHPRRDLEQNTIATYNVLEAMRANGVKRIAFSSTGSVYGEATVIPTPEDAQVCWGQVLQYDISNAILWHGKTAENRIPRSSLSYNVQRKCKREDIS